MHQRPFKQIDVFTATPYFGNPLAVVLEGEGLDDVTMQRFAQWTNLSETTFLLPPTHPTADYRVRIFTPGGELPFAGHPTLGSCHSWLQAGGKPKSSEFIVQECKQGLVKIRREGSGSAEQLAFAAPPLGRSAPSPVVLARVAAALGVQAAHIVAAQLLDNGPVWLGVLLDSPETVLQLSPNHAELDSMDVKVGVAGIYVKNAASPLIGRINRESQAFVQNEKNDKSIAFSPDLEVRGFAASIGINEDPVTGSLNASLAQWLMADGHMPERYTASQGVCLGRAGELALARDASGQVWVGGQSVTCIDGSVTL
ncbi:MAG: PhzF family phenazine biosynthesis protein [Polaromonas sp.]|nr:MAG: PhzF family phenazine biosynthesis protein [Polaromonas sp.]